MELTGNRNVVVREEPMQGIVDREAMNKLQRRFCQIANVFAFAMNEDGKMLTEMSGTEEEVAVIYDKIGIDGFLYAYHRVVSNSLEEQVIEDTAYDNVKIAAISVRVNGVPYLNWLICGVYEQTEAMNPEAVLQNIRTTITEDSFLNVLDLVRVLTNKLVQSQFQLENISLEAMRSKDSQVSMGESLKRIEAMTEIVQMLESDKAIEEVTKDILQVAVRYLKISSAQVFRINQDGRSMDILAEVCNQGIVSLFNQIRNIERPELLRHEKTFVTNAEAALARAERDELKAAHLKAFTAIPIQISGKTGMYACFCECKKSKAYTVEEIKFMNDVTKIIQSVILKRIQKNSLISSYASMEAILDHIGAAVCVEDEKSGKMLFSNKILKSTFPEEIRNGMLKKMLTAGADKVAEGSSYEITNSDGTRWYDICTTSIKWVDGRPSNLYAAYDITEKKIYQKKIEQQAYTDFLTGLYNRMCCVRDLAWHIDEAKNKGKRGALLYLDLDDFKHINDGLGHQYGDVLLKAISHSLQRIEGIQNTCYRMGGDEFVIIIPYESFPRVALIIEAIKDIFSKPWFLKDADYYCTMSMGVVEFPTAGDNVQDLIKKADIAMYEAKKTGKNRVAEYTTSINSSSNKRLDMEKNMRDATVQGYREFEVYYQPIIDISQEGAPCSGAEALIRWNSHELGFIPPSDFIPLAEYLGLINPIGNYVLKEACKACKRWNDNGHPNYKVNVNLSVVQLLQPDITEIIEQAIKETGINPRNLTLEVTESLAINDVDRMKSILYKIKELGVRIALDDFGTGYSSLNHIREIPFDVIKVDQSFVIDLADDTYSQAFIKMIGELASTIGVSLCVEGIETKEQFKVLEGMQVRLIQGYYFDRPMQREKFETKYVLNSKTDKT